jgi:hypothetical protein
MEKPKLNENKSLKYVFLNPIFPGNNDPENIRKNKAFSLYASIGGRQDITPETLENLKRDYRGINTSQETGRICLECPSQRLTRWSANYEVYRFEGSVFDGGGSWNEIVTEEGIVLPHKEFTLFDGRIEFSLTAPMKRLLKKHYMSDANNARIERGKWYSHIYFVLCDKHSKQIEKTSNKILERLLNNKSFPEVEINKGSRITLDEENTPKFGEDLRACREVAKNKVIASMPITKYIEHYGRCIGDRDGGTYP